MFGDRLRELREESGMTQEELGKLLSVTKQAVYSYEKGENEPNIDALVKLGDIFGVSLDYLLGRTKQKENLCIKDRLILETINDKHKKKIILDLCNSLSNYNLVIK